MWREVRSIKNTLQVVVGSQAVSEDVLYTVLVKEEGILNSKPVNYASRDITETKTKLFLSSFQFVMMNTEC